MKCVVYYIFKVRAHDLLRQCQQYAEEKQVTIVLKGAPTFIIHPYTAIHISPFGDPGMATAGSGDILTGMLAAVLAQGVRLPEAVYLAVGLHGIAGSDAAQNLSSYCMIASDILKHLSLAIKSLEA